MLTLTSLTYQWPGSVLQQIDLEAYAGQIVLIKGPSGIGKTTLFDVISGFHKPKSGTLRWNDENLLEKLPWERPVTTMFQADNFFPHLSVRDNLMLGLKKSAEQTEKMIKKLEFLNVFSLLNKKPEQLSGGELQRVSLIRALMRKKPLLLLDEPFSALDPYMVKKASELIVEYTEEVQSVTLIISHQTLTSPLYASHLIELRQ